MQALDLSRLSRSPAGLLIIDYSIDGTPGGRLTAKQVEALKCRPDGGRRLVLAYLSIGEAESYRFYWQSPWLRSPPDWLGPENANWPGNYRVRYWHAAWQAMIFGRPEAYLDQLIDAGFDGVLLDGVDAFEYWSDTEPKAAVQMVEFVSRLSDYAARRAGCFFVLPLNPRVLLGVQHFRAAISGVVVEDLWFGVNHDGRRNPPDEVARALGELRPAQEEGLPVLVLEYLRAGALRESLVAEATPLGMVASFARRALDRLSEPAAAGPNAPPLRAQCSG